MFQKVMANNGAGGGSQDDPQRTCSVVATMHVLLALKDMSNLNYNP